MGSIMYATLALLVPYLQTLMNYPVVITGLVLAPRGAGLMLAAMFCGRLIGKISPRWLVGTGFVTGAYALWLMTFWTPDISQWDLVSAGFIQGISIGLLAIPINVIAFATLSPQLRTEATGVYSLVRNLGSAIGISVTAALLQSNTQVNHAICRPTRRRSIGRCNPGRSRGSGISPPPMERPCWTRRSPGRPASSRSSTISN